MNEKEGKDDDVASFSLHFSSISLQWERQEEDVGGASHKPGAVLNGP